MGKGSGSCARPALRISELAEERPDVDGLRTAVEEARSYPERLLGLERLRAALVGVEPEIEMHPQRLDDEFEARLRDRPGDLAAVFLDDTPFVDGLLYAEWARRRRQAVAHSASVSRSRILYLRKRVIEAGAESETAEELWEMEHVTIARASAPTAWPEAEVDEFLAEALPRLWLRLDEDLRGILRDSFTSRSWTTTREWLDEEPAWRVIGETSERDEAGIEEVLRGLGAEVVAHDVELPTYQSRHRLLGGERLQVDVDGARVSYVPHRALGEERIERAIDSYRLSAPEEDPAAIVRAALADWAPDGMLVPHDAVVWIDEDTGMATIKPRTCISESAQYDLSDWDVSYDHGGEWRPFRDEHLERQEDDGLRYRLVDGTRTLVLESDLPELERRRARLEEMLDGSVVEAEHDVDEDGLPTDFIAAALSARGMKERDALAIAEIVFGDRLATRSSSRVRPRPQRAPMSERGRFSVEGLPPAEAADLLKRVGLAGAPVEEIPTRLVYGGPRRTGRILPRHEAYAEHPVPPLPSGSMVVHGMTGVRSDEEAMDRLETLVESGGLKSIAERRRASVACRSLSPIGDIASGLDVGVPCKIGPAPVYGSHVFFGLRPDVLDRRDLWFSDRDFGAGDDRYDRYGDYARSLGASRMHDPPSPAARELHLSTVSEHDGNEVYFRHEIPWSDVDTLFVARSTLGTVRPRIERWRQEGLLPAHIVVRAFDGQRGEHVESAVRARAEQLETDG